MVALRCDASYHAHSTDVEEIHSAIKKEIPVEHHQKKAGNGYKKGSPLYDKQQALKKKDEPVPAADRSKPSIAVIIGFLLVGLAILLFAAFVNQRELVWSLNYEFQPVQSKFEPTYLQPQPVPVRPVQVSMPQSGVIYANSAPPKPMSPRSAQVYASMPAAPMSPRSAQVYASMPAAPMSGPMTVGSLPPGGYSPQSGGVVRSMR